MTEKEFRKGRLSDYLNRQDIDFIPINDAHVFNLESGRPIASRIFVLLNKRHINWVHPMREPHLEIRGGHEDILLDQDAAEL
ncbi:MAG: hypothetical protein HYV63_17325 [Candidatus Schekmanbacteria bacterium]|nr:hypothetical protein [Candidatus Schekmanbacteria bacterium]